MYDRIKILPHGKIILSFQRRDCYYDEDRNHLFCRNPEVKPGNDAAFIKTWDRLARWTFTTMEGRQPAVLIQDAGNSQKFISFGPWKDMDTLTQWRNTRVQAGVCKVPGALQRYPASYDAVRCIRG